MTSENNWQSQTFWGFGLAVVLGFAQAFGIVPEGNVVVGVAQLVSILTGIWGARNAARKAKR